MLRLSLDFGSFHRFAAHEITERRARLFRRRLEDGTFVRGDANAEDGRSVSLLCHAYDISTQMRVSQGIPASPAGGRRGPEMG
jgi:hypothetical protein